MTIENPRGQILRSHALTDLKAPTLISFIDMARWMAAVMVMVGHLRNPLLLGWGSLTPAERTLPVKLWYFITGYHAEAVLIFFVLSGYLVGGLAAARGAEGRWEPGGYAIDRISRLFIAFLPALLLTLVLDWAGSHWFGGTGLYNGTHPMVVEKIHGEIFQDRLTPGIFVGNMFMLQNYFVPELGSNDPLWTLSSEFWFYAVFGLALTAWLARSNRMRWLGAISAMAIIATLGPGFVGSFGLWAIGFAISQLPRPPLSHPLNASFMLIGWLGMLRIKDAFFDAYPDWKMASQYVLAALFAWLILSIRGRKAAWLEQMAPFNKVMADFSYSLYLIHFPLIFFSLALLGRVTGLAGFRRAFSPTDKVGVATYIAMILFCLAAAWCFSRVTERRTAALRLMLRARFLGKSEAVSPPGRVPNPEA